MASTSVSRSDKASSADSREDRDLTLAEVVGSVFAAGFGVQSRENKLRDFNRGRPLQFIAAGLVLTFALLFGLIAVVNLIV